MRTLKIRVVETLDVTRRTIEPQLLLQGTPSNSSVVEGRNGTITSRANSPPATFSTMYWIPSVSMSRSSPSTPVESLTVCTPTTEPWRIRTKLHHATSSSGSSEKTSTSTIRALTITDLPA